MASKIGFLIVGAQKCGTSSLFEYLRSSKNIFMPDGKELAFFSSDKNLAKGYDFYESYFDGSKTQISGEASPQYMFDVSTASEIYKYNPDMKIIVCLRDPTERAYSHYKMSVKRGYEKRRFSEIVESGSGMIEGAYIGDFGYIELGLYSKHIKEYCDIFGRKNVHVVYLSRLFLNTREEMLKTFMFLDIEFDGDAAIFNQKFNQAGKARVLGVNKLVKRASGNWFLKKIAYKFIGTDGVKSLLWKIDTKWNVQVDKSHKKIDAVTEDKLRTIYLKDKKCLETYLGEKMPW